MRTNLMKHIYDLANADGVKLKDLLCSGSRRCSLGLCMDNMANRHPDKYVMSNNRVTLRDAAYSWPITLIMEYLEITTKECVTISKENNDTEKDFEEMALWITNNILTVKEQIYMLSEFKLSEEFN